MSEEMARSYLESVASISWANALKIPMLQTIPGIPFTAASPEEMKAAIRAIKIWSRDCQKCRTLQDADNEVHQYGREFTGDHRSRRRSVWAFDELIEGCLGKGARP